MHADRLRAGRGERAPRGRAGAQGPIRPIADHHAAKSVENALRVLLAIGGSTNAIVHLTAIAGRAGVEVDLDGA